MKGFWIQAGIIAITTTSLVALMTFPEDGGEFILNNNVSVLYDSNILGRKGGDSDVQFLYAPTLHFSRDPGFVAVDAAIGGEFGFFMDRSDFDYQDLNSSIGLTFPNTDGYPYKAKIGAGYDQISELNRFLGERLESDHTTIDSELRYDFTERWAIVLALGWSDTSFNKAGVESRIGQLFGQTSWHGGGQLVYKFSDHLNASVGYHYTQSDSRVRSKNHAWTLDLSGEISPKVNGSVGLTYNQLESAYGRFSDPFLFADLIWDITDDIAVRLAVQSQYRTTTTGEPARSRSGELGIEFGIEGYWLATLGVGMENLRYENAGLTRTDDLWYARGSLKRTFASGVSATISLRYEDQDSSEGAFSFDRFATECAVSFSF